MRLLGSLILTLSLFASAFSSSVPLTLCMSGRAQGTESLNKSGSCEYGAYNGPTGPGTLTATLNEYFYSSGVKCGDCFEVSGPKGKTVVRVVNFCSAGTCPSEKPLFMLTPDAFQEISADPLAVVYDAGFRKVSCDASGPIKAQVSADSSKYYVKLLLFNNEVGIESVTIKGKDMASPVSMVRQGSAQFVWSQAGKEMMFPANVVVTSQYGGSVTMTLNSLSMDILKFSGNFVTPKSSIIKNAPQSCSLSASPLAIYQNGLTEGWNYWSSRSYSQINTTDSSSHSVGSTKSLSMILMGSSSALTLARSGDFETTYFTGIKFNIKANTTMNGLRVYFPNEQNKYWSPSSPITTSWATYTVPFSSLQHKTIESAITFANTENINVYINIDNIQFIASPSAGTTGYANGNETASGLATGASSTTSGTTAGGKTTASTSVSSTTAGGKTTAGGSGVSTTGTAGSEDSMAASTSKTTSHPTTATGKTTGMTGTTTSSIEHSGETHTSEEHHSSSSIVKASLLLVSAALAFASL
ncbi:hypothetical protein RB653_008472 [Dictyostelium firmibasis]|uniref:Expansin-like EG45 domain-containing protein n=1 Tax=Dictyostelium firmibasis TaxID=79012 RepID=A0AAN7TSM4_9MYCE